MAIAGKGGSAKWGTTSIGAIAEWKLDIDVDMLDVTTMDSNGWKEFLDGLKEWSGNVNVKFDTTDAGQTAMRTAVLGGVSAAIELSLDATHKFSGTSYLKKASTGAKVSDAEEFDFEFQGTGALDYA